MKKNYKFSLVLHHNSQFGYVTYGTINVTLTQHSN